MKEYIAKIEREEFCFILDKEVAKISTLYRQQLTDIKSDLQLLENEIQHATLASGGDTFPHDLTNAANPPSILRKSKMSFDIFDSAACV